MGMVICLEWGANDFHMVQLMPLHPIISCFIEIQVCLIFLVLAYPGCPGKEAVIWVSIFYSYHFWKNKLRVCVDIQLLDVGCMFTLQACVPYFEMLEKWIYKGIIQDPYAEVWNSMVIIVTVIRVMHMWLLKAMLSRQCRWESSLSSVDECRVSTRWLLNSPSQLSWAVSSCYAANLHTCHCHLLLLVLPSCESGRLSQLGSAVGGCRLCPRLYISQWLMW